MPLNYTGRDTSFSILQWMFRRARYLHTVHLQCVPNFLWIEILLSITKIKTNITYLVKMQTLTCHLLINRSLPAKRSAWCTQDEQKTREIRNTVVIAENSVALGGIAVLQNERKNHKKKHKIPFPVWSPHTFGISGHWIQVRGTKIVTPLIA